MARPTLVSLAKELGVSRQTVSNVLNAPHLVKPETRERVQAAIEASGYRPNVAAQALRRQRSLTLAMRIHPSPDGIHGAVMDRLMYRLVEAARRHGYYLLPITADSEHDEAERLISLFRNGSIDGCLLSSTSEGDQRPRRLAEFELPFALFGRPWFDQSAAMSWVDIDGAAAEEAATRHLWNMGFRRIGFLGMPADSGPSDERRRGWEKAVSELPVPGPDLLFISREDAVEDGLRGALELVEQGADAFVCASDSLALGAVEALRVGAGLDPRQAPVIGFDDSPVANALGISSIAQPVERAADVLVERLIAEINDRDETARGERSALLAGELKLRGRLAPTQEPVWT